MWSNLKWLSFTKQYEIFHWVWACPSFKCYLDLIFFSQNVCTYIHLQDNVINAISLTKWASNVICNTHMHYRTTLGASNHSNIQVRFGTHLILFLGIFHFFIQFSFQFFRALRFLFSPCVCKHLIVKAWVCCRLPIILKLLYQIVELLLRTVSSVLLLITCIYPV